MNEALADSTAAKVEGATTAKTVSLVRIFLDFLVIGSTSFGGPVPYLRDRLVARNNWLDDKQFVELLSISQSLPGLNATNMAILVGDKLRGFWGAALGVLGICLPGGLLMFAVGVIYRSHGEHVWATAALKGVAAASVGLVLATVVQLLKRSLEQRFDIVFVVLTAVAVSGFHLSVPMALIVVGAVAIVWHRPVQHRKADRS